MQRRMLLRRTSRHLRALRSTTTTDRERPLVSGWSVRVSRSVTGDARDKCKDSVDSERHPLQGLPSTMTGHKSLGDSTRHGPTQSQVISELNDQPLYCPLCPAA